MMPSSFDNMTQREKIILITTIAVAVFALFYYVWLDRFLTEYDATTRAIIEKKLIKSEQEERLKREVRIERKFRAISDSVASRKGERSPQFAFIEDIAKFISFSEAVISPYRVETVPGAPEYAYLVISVDGIRGKYSKIAEILKGFKERQLLVRKLHIQQYRPETDPTLMLSVDLAQLVRVADLDATDQQLIREALERQQ